MINKDENKKEKIEYYKQLAEDIKKNIQARKRPLIVEFSGLPKSGKTTVINSLSLFLRRNGIPAAVLSERASTCPIKNKLHPDFNIWTANMTLSQLLALKQSSQFFVILIDRGIYDSLIWMNLLNNLGKLKSEELKIFETYYLLDRFRKSIDLVIYMECSIEKSLEREFKDLLTDKEGSIMNKAFLTDFLSASKQSYRKYSDHFSQIISIDTSEKKTLEGVEEVVSAVLDSLKVLSDEEILFFNKSLFAERLNFSGLTNDVNKFKVLERIIKTNSDKDKRSFVENQPHSIQIIVMAYIVCNKKIALFTKREITADKRFHNKRIAWIGGHLQSADIEENGEKTVLKSMLNCLQREIFEEISLSLDSRPVFKGLTYDRTNSKSLQHLGVVFQIDLKDEKIMNSINLKAYKELSGQEIEIEFVDLTPKAFSERIDSIEPWSYSILESLLSIDMEGISTERQLVLF
ncbi:MAG: deoxynucleoside kinase [Proteobacteria bacterium]|nr:deoxynucleoside kinase [Pseudomonadota bacterium]MBU1585096.1 deoxynucleoside kinase [Pseudomonadota bacterium]